MNIGLLQLAWPNKGSFSMVRLVGLSMLAMLFSMSPAIASDGGVDAVLIMDSSGSMAKNDPKKLRVPAAKLFMSLLGEDDRIGLISFSDNGYPVLHLTAPTASTNKKILSSVDKVSSKGVYTNLHAALVKGVAMLDKESKKGQEKMLVLMSDGKMDVGDTDEDWDLTKKVEGALLDSIKEKNIKIYTIAFTEASDVDLLKKLANDSNALFKLAKSDKDLHEVFSAIFESAKSPDMLPIEGREFVVDGSIKEVTIVASKERSDVRVYLQTPSGKKLSSDDASASLKWFQSHHFDMITVKKPEPGTWKLISVGGKNRAYIVTDMKLAHNPQQPNLTIDQPMTLEIWLEENGKRMEREAVLTNTTFEIEITFPEGGSARFDLFDRGEYGDRTPADGIYANTISYENPGSYRIDMLAQSETFKRQKTVHFEVAAPSVDKIAPPVMKKAVPEPKPVPKEMKPEPKPVDEPAKKPAVEPKKEKEPEAKADIEKVDEEVDEESEEEMPAKKKKKGVSMGVAIGIFVGINLLLGLIGGGIWWFLSKRKAKKADADDDEDSDEDE